MYASRHRDKVMDRRRPLGLDGGHPPLDGIAPYAGARNPGPIPTDHAAGAIESPVPSSAAGNDAAADAVLALPFAVDHDYYRVRRVDTDTRRGFSEVPVAADRALAIVERAISQQANNQGLVRLLETTRTRLAGVHEHGIYVLLWLRPEAPRRTVMAPSAAPRTSAPTAPVIPRTTRSEEPTMPPLQATILRRAAQTGKPFCEVCALAAAQRASTAERQPST